MKEVETVSNQFAEMHAYLENLKNEFSRLQVRDHADEREPGGELLRLTPQPPSHSKNRGASFRIQNVGMTAIRQAGDLVQVAILNHTECKEHCCEDRRDLRC